MPASLVARRLSVTRGPVTVLSDVDLTLAPGRRLGVVGPNGIGKSTLLRALAGQIDDRTSSIEGEVERSPRAATVGYLPQEPDRSDRETVEHLLARRTGVANAQHDLDAATQALADAQAGAADRYSDALERWLSLGAADFDARSGEVLADLALDERIRRQPTATLSGGEAARVSLASLLLARFDVFLLDEPTNDLDIDGLERLERWIVGLDAPTALVSHDREFLKQTITDVVEIDHHSRSTTTFAGGWSAFLRERDIAREHAQQRYDEYANRRQALVDRRQREREWAAKGAGRARRSGETDKFIRQHQLNQTEQLAGRAARTDRALDRLEVVEEPRTKWELRYAIPTLSRSGDVVVTADAAVVELDGFRLGPVDVQIGFGDCVAILGPNGSGKSTLIDLLVGRHAPTSGRCSLGSNVVVGEIEQARSGLVGDAGLVAAFCEATSMTVGDARTLLAKFELGPQHLDRPGSTLSPGERTRASMAVLMANGANLLVFDEPTNHLDLDAIEQIEDALTRYTGTLLMVTHDRALLRAVRFDRVLHLVAGLVHEGRVVDGRVAAAGGAIGGPDAGPDDDADVVPTLDRRARRSRVDHDR